MSYYDDASLVLIPSGTKTSKVYSQKPTDGTGDLTFSRASTATRTNASGVIESVASDVPRLDYSGGATCPRLLLEPQRTNLILRSEEFDNASWVKFGSTITANATTSPDGTSDADLYTTSSTSDFLQQSLNVTSGVAYTISAFVKNGDANLVDLIFTGAGYPSAASIQFNLTTQTANVMSGTATASIQDYGNGWYRIIGTSTAGATASMNIRFSSASLNTISTFYIWGAQLEAGAYPTTYIPTTTAAVTRLADAASKTGVSSLIGQTEGTLFVECQANRISSDVQNIELGDGTTNNRINIRLTIGNTFQLVIVQAGAVVYNQTSVSTFAQGQTIKIAAAYKSGDVTQVYVNGVSVASATAGTITGNFSAIYSASIGGTSGPFFSPIAQAAIFPTRLTNAQLAELTTL